MSSPIDDKCRETKNNLSLSETIQRSLKELKEKVVFAESCTGGEIVATIAKVAWCGLSDD